MCYIYSWRYSFPQSLSTFACCSMQRVLCVYCEYVEDAAHILWEWAVIYAHIIPSPVQVTFQITSVCSMNVIYCCHLFIIMMILWHCTGTCFVGKQPFVHFQLAFCFKARTQGNVPFWIELFFAVFDYRYQLSQWSDILP